MRKEWAIGGVLGCLVLGVVLLPAFAGDSLYGKVTEVKAADLVVLDYGAGQYDVRIVGLDAPRAEPLASQSRDFVAKLVLGKNVRMRFEQRADNGEMVSRLFTDDPVLGIQEVGVELLKAGLARSQVGYEDKYGELLAAENEARLARRGLWSSTQPK